MKKVGAAKLSTFVIGVTGLFILIFLAEGNAQDCDALKPPGPVTPEVSDQFKASANVLFKKLGSGDVENKYRAIQQQFGNPDQVHEWDSTLYMFCTLLKSSHLSDKDKLDSFMVLVREQREGPPPTSSSSAPRLKLPGDTGWIFVGYFNKKASEFIEGPYVEVISATMRVRHDFVELGDTVRTKKNTKVYIVDYSTRGPSEKLTSPTVMEGANSAENETGIVIPAGVELIVRDVKTGHLPPSNPDYAIWARVVLADFAGP